MYSTFLMKCTTILHIQTKKKQQTWEASQHVEHERTTGESAGEATAIGYYK